MKRLVTVGAALAALVLVCMAQSPGSAEKKAAGNTWEIVELPLPEQISKADLIGISPQSNSLLVMATVDWKEQLWKYDGKEFSQVKYADDSPVVGDSSFLVWPWEPVVYGIADKKNGYSYVIVSGGVAHKLEDEKGMVLHADFLSADSISGRMLILAKHDESTRRALYLVEEHTAHPLLGPDGKQLNAQAAQLSMGTDERLYLVTLQNHEVINYLLTDDGARELPTPQAPGDLAANLGKCRPVYTKERTIVSGIDKRTDRARAWLVKDGKAQFVTDAEGKALDHKTIDLWYYAPDTYIYCTDKDAGLETHSVYFLDGAKAVKVDLGDNDPGKLKWIGGSVAGFTGRDSRGTPALWRFKGDMAAKVALKDGTGVIPDEFSSVRTVGSRAVVRFWGDGMMCAGILDGNTVTPLRSKPGYGAPRLADAVIENDGALFLFAGNYKTGKSRECLGLLDANYEYETLATSDGTELEGQSIQAERVGNTLYARVDRDDLPPALYAIRRK
ncbi:MAG: hypothetical protein KDB82_10840 [Planctomycetes bacterium]|nr:hypothetical protein [Planctomycetota bacterium]